MPVDARSLVEQKLPAARVAGITAGRGDRARGIAALGRTEQRTRLPRGCRRAELRLIADTAGIQPGGALAVDRMYRVI
jgi:hypothetical protein